MANILFICRHNRFRSKVAEAIFNQIDGGKNEARSRGLFIDINSANSLREIMMEKGFPIEDAKSRQVSEEDVEWADKIVIVANNVNPEMFPSEKTEVWEISDTDEDDFAGIRERVGEIEEKVKKLIRDLNEGKENKV